MSTTLKTLLVAVGITAASVANANVLDTSTQPSLAAGCMIVSQHISKDAQFGSMQKMAQQVIPDIRQYTQRQDNKFQQAYFNAVRAVSPRALNASPQELAQAFKTCVDMGAKGRL